MDRLGAPAVMRRTLQAWMERLLVALVAVTAASILLREPLAALIGVPDHPWAAAAILPTGVLFMLLSLQRGALQGLRAYSPVGLSIVGEAGRPARLRPDPRRRSASASRAPSSARRWRSRSSRSRSRSRSSAAPAPSSAPSSPARSLRGLIGDGWVPIIGLLLLAALQNVDVIIAKRELPVPRGRLLRGRGRRGEVRRVGGDRPRPAAAARGHAPRGRGPGPAPRAAARARGAGRHRDARAPDLHLRRRAAAAHRLRRPHRRRGRAAAARAGDDAAGRRPTSRCST